MTTSILPPPPIWLAAYGEGGHCERYSCAAIISAPDEAGANQATAQIALLEINTKGPNARYSRGISYQCEQIDPAAGLEATTLYAHRLTPGAKAIVDMQWAEREAAAPTQHGQPRTSEVSGEDSVDERAKALGFESADEMWRNEAEVARRRSHHEQEIAYQESPEAQLRRYAAGVPASTWVTMDVVAPAVGADEIESAVTSYPRPGASS